MEQDYESDQNTGSYVEIWIHDLTLPLSHHHRQNHHHHYNFNHHFLFITMIIMNDHT